jgi:hypothetical protein
VPNLNTLLDDHVLLAYESVDRIFLNGYVAKLQEPDQLAWFLGQHRGEELPRYELLGKITAEFVAAVERLAQDQGVPVVHFEKGQRKETIAEPYFAEHRRVGAADRSPGRQAGSSPGRPPCRRRLFTPR